MLGTAGAGVACLAIGLVLALAPPDRVADVGLVPAAAVVVAPTAARASAGASIAARPADVPDTATPAAAPAPSPAANAAPPGTVPVTVELPDRDLRAPVVPTATGPDGAVAVPDPPSTVGWWSPGALAGAVSGTTVLVGHVDSAASGLGAFAVLRQVGVGERVELDGADGRTLAYRVVARRQLGKADLPAELFARTGPPRLVLITCGGRFDRATRHYTDNVVVYAVPA